MAGPFPERCEGQRSQSVQSEGRDSQRGATASDSVWSFCCQGISRALRGTGMPRESRGTCAREGGQRFLERCNSFPECRSHLVVKALPRALRGAEVTECPE